LTYPSPLTIASDELLNEKKLHATSLKGILILQDLAIVDDERVLDKIVDEREESGMAIGFWNKARNFFSRRLHYA